MWNLLDPDVLAWMFEGDPGEAFIRDLFELRAVIEPAAAAFAARRRTPEQLLEMERALAGMRTFGLGRPEGRAADQRFHRVILDATGNEPMAALATSVGAAVSWTTKFKLRLRDLPNDPLPAHERVFEAIRDADPARARRAMETLLHDALDEIASEGAVPLRRGRRA